MRDSFYITPPFYKETQKKLAALKREYDFVRVGAIGKSVQGRGINAFFLGNMQNPVVFAGAFHALEWLTESLLFRLAEEILKEIKTGGTLKCALNKRGVIIVPCVNPDGVELVLTRGASALSFKPFTDKICRGDYSLWQANIRGVDLNHNFDAGHQKLLKMEREAGITGPSVRRYGGKMPLSENETRALVSLCRSFKVSRVYAFHSQGEEIFYSYGDKIPSGSFEMAKMLSELSGYELVKGQGLYSHGGFKDWFIKEFSLPGFTIEIGRGKNPLPMSELTSIFARLYEMMVLALVI